MIEPVNKINERRYFYQILIGTILGFVILGAVTILFRTSHDYLMYTKWKYYGEPVRGCSDIYKLTEADRDTRNLTWTIQYRYLSNDMFLTVLRPNTSITCTYISKGQY